MDDRRRGSRRAAVRRDDLRDAFRLDGVQPLERWASACPRARRDGGHVHRGALAARDLKPLWKIAKQLMPEVPLPTTQAWLWKWDDVLPLAKRAGELITLERGGDRRVLAFANPGLRGLPFTSTTLWGE